MAIEAKSGRNTSALMKPLTPQGPLAAIVGANNLQKPTDKRVILADAKLKLVFGKDECTMFEMNKFIAQYLK
jgi:chromatin remodeling complex protein RSC6